jgi:hypothetical protein
MKRLFTEEEVIKMCSQSYLRGMSVQYSASSKRKTKPKMVFIEWVKQLINECPKIGV